MAPHKILNENLAGQKSNEYGTRHVELKYLSVCKENLELIRADDKMEHFKSKSLVGSSLNLRKNDDRHLN